MSEDVIELARLSDLLKFPGAIDVVGAWLRGISLDPPVTAWEFGNQNVNLTSELANEAGRWSVDRTPYLREILTNPAASSPAIGTILMKGSQLGASQAGLVLLLYIIAVIGGPCLVVCPTAKAAELYAKQRLEPLIRNCEPAAAKLPKNKGKESGNTILLKSFPGGILRLVGAGAVNPLKSMTVKVVVFEEPDEFELDLEGQGDATKIVLRRITTYGRRAKWFANCTPGLRRQPLAGRVARAPVQGPEPVGRLGRRRAHRHCEHRRRRLVGLRLLHHRPLGGRREGRHQGLGNRLDADPGQAAGPRDRGRPGCHPESADDTADVFLDEVAANRGLSREVVRSEQFGQGAVLIGQHAVDAGLADEVSTFDDVLEELAEAA